MPTNTPNLNLTTYDIATEGSVLYISAWENLISTLSTSNMNKLDGFAGTTIATLQLLQDRPGSTHIPATTADGVNYTATVSGLTSLSSGMIIYLEPDDVNTGNPYLNINSLGNKTMYKIDVDGVAVQLEPGDLIPTRKILLVYDGFSWYATGGINLSDYKISGAIGSLIAIGSSNQPVASSIVLSGGKIGAESIKFDSTLNKDVNNNLMLGNSGITAGTYKGTTYDKYGRATASSGKVNGSSEVNIASGVTNNFVSINPTGGIVDAGYSASSFSLSTHNHSGTYLPIGGKAADSSKLNNYVQQSTPTASSIPLSDGSGKLSTGWLNLGTGISNTGGALTLSTSGVSAGTYGGFTIDTYGRITSANNSETILADGNGLNYSVVTHVSGGNCYITILAADGSSQSATNYSTFNVGGTIFKLTSSVQFYIGGADYYKWVARGIAGNDAQLFVYAINNNGSLAFGVAPSPNLTVVGSYRTDLGSGIGSTPGLGNMVSNVFSFAAGSKCRVIGRINVKQGTGNTWVSPVTAKVINYPIFATDYMLQTAKTVNPAAYGSITNCYLQYRIDRDKCSVTASAKNSSISTSVTSGQVAGVLIMPGKATVVTNHPAFVEVFASDGWRIANGSMTPWGDYTIMTIYKTMLGGSFDYNETGLKFLISAEYAIDE